MHNSIAGLENKHSTKEQTNQNKIKEKGKK